MRVVWVRISVWFYSGAAGARGCAPNICSIVYVFHSFFYHEFSTPTHYTSWAWRWFLLFSFGSGRSAKLRAEHMLHRLCVTFFFFCHEFLAPSHYTSSGSVEVARTIVAPPSSVVKCLWEAFVGVFFLSCACVCRCRGCCSLSVCVCACDLLIFWHYTSWAWTWFLFILF